ncbi:MAG: DUF5666 domain-containing protein [Omnitrophica WOR_2 bacterium]
MKKALLIVGIAIIALALMGASFYGGTIYERNQARQVQSRFFASRGLNGTPPADGNFQGSGNNPGGGRFFGGGVSGQVKSIDGNVMTISTTQNVLTVNLSDSTVYLKSSNAAQSDVVVGDQVLVTGQRDSSGNMTASQVLITKPAQ